MQPFEERLKELELGMLHLEKRMLRRDIKVVFK